MNRKIALSTSARSLAVMAALVPALTASTLVFAMAAPASAVNDCGGGLKTQPPYATSGAWGFARSIVADVDLVGPTGVHCYGYKKAKLYQYYGGAWHAVATNEQWGDDHARAHVACTGAQTSYSFATWGSMANGEAKFSAVRVITC